MVAGRDAGAPGVAELVALYFNVIIMLLLAGRFRASESLAHAGSSARGQYTPDFWPRIGGLEGEGDGCRRKRTQADASGTERNENC